MAKPLRLEYEGAVYHVTSRGNARGQLLQGRFQAILAKKESQLRELPDILLC